MKEIIKNSPYYPSSLLNIKDSPSRLFVEGNLDLLNSDSIAIIGSRYASEEGMKTAELFSKGLSQVGLTIVSGLALGIDTIAHKFSYNQKGKTIAVLGSGLNKIFPPENIDLYKKILENDGLIISEYAPNSEPSSSSFPKRNRIISGISLGILVVEAKYRSGTGITATYAREQNKPIFAIPHEIDNPYGIGTNRLLKKGAIAVTNPIDILEKLKLPRLKNAYINLQDNQSEKQNSILISDPKQSKIFKLIKKTPITPNELTRITKFSINEIQSILFILEMDGYIKKAAGGYICT